MDPRNTESDGQAVAAGAAGGRVPWREHLLNSGSSDVLRWTGASAVTTAVAAVLLGGFTVDDAEISYAFAQQLSEGRPLGTIAAGEPIVAGFSNPTWTLLLATAGRVGLSISATATALGAMLLCATGVACSAVIGRLVHRRAVAFLGALVPLSFTLGLWTMSGLENGLVAFLVVTTTLLLVREEQDRATGWQALGSAAVLGVLVVSRPDAIVYLGTASVALALARRVGSGEPTPIRQVAAQVAWWVSVPIALLATWALWHTVRFGSPLPNTVYAKVSRSSAERVQDLLDPTSPVLQTLTSFIADHGMVLLLPLIAIAAGRWRSPVRTVALMAFGTLALPLAEVDWMNGYRFFTAAVPMGIVLAAIGVDRLAAPVAQGARPRAWVVGAIVTLTFSTWVMANLSLSLDAHRSRFAGQVTADSVDGRTAWLLAEGRRLGLDDPLVMTPDVGAATFRHRTRILDSAGLIDPQISHLRESPEKRHRYAFVERRPDLVHTHGNWTGIWDLNWARMRNMGYVALRTDADDYGQHGDFVRRDVLVVPRRTAAAPEVSLDHIRTLPVAEPGGTLVVRAAISIPHLPNGPTSVRVRLTSPQGSVVSEASVPLGMGLLRQARPTSSEAMLHVARLGVGPEQGPVTVTMDLVDDRETKPLGQWGVDVSTGALQRHVTRSLPVEQVSLLFSTDDADAAAGHEVPELEDLRTRVLAQRCETLDGAVNLGDDDNIDTAVRQVLLLRARQAGPLCSPEVRDRLSRPSGRGSGVDRAYRRLALVSLLAPNDRKVRSALHDARSELAPA